MGDVNRFRGRDCKSMVEWVVIGFKKDGTERRHPFTVKDGVNTKRSHFLDCPNADAFGGPERARPYPETPPQKPSPAGANRTLF